MHRAQALAALDHVPGSDPGRRLEALLALGEARGVAGDRAGRREAFARALESARLPRARRRPGAGRDRLLRPHRVVAAGRGGARGACARRSPRRATPTRVRAAILTRLAYLDARVSREQAEPTAREAVALARASGDPDLVIDACYVLHFVVASPESFAERAALTDEMRRARRGGGAARGGGDRPRRRGERRARPGRRGARARTTGRRRRRSRGSARTRRWCGTCSPTTRGSRTSRGASRTPRSGTPRRGSSGGASTIPTRAGVFGAHRVGLARERGRLRDRGAALRAAPRRCAGPPRLDERGRRAGGGRPRARSARRGDASRRSWRAGLAAIPRNLRWVSTLTELAQLCADLGDTSRAGELEALLRAGGFAPRRAPGADLLRRPGEPRSRPPRRTPGAPRRGGRALRGGLLRRRGPRRAPDPGSSPRRARRAPGPPRPPLRRPLPARTFRKGTDLRV